MDRRWDGKTVACIASGPSLTAEDCEIVRLAGIPAIAVNSSWKRAPFADIIYAGDLAWWKAYAGEITVAAERWTCCRQAATLYGANFHKAGGAYNSGLRALQLAIHLGAKKVLLLGYDASVKRGTHWHGSHEKTKNPDESRCLKWVKQFSMLDIKGAEVINCAPGSALECFPKMSLIEAMAMEMPGA